MYRCKKCGSADITGTGFISRGRYNIEPPEEKEGNFDNEIVDFDTECVEWHCGDCGAVEHSFEEIAEWSNEDEK